MSIQYQKSQSVAKSVTAKGDELSAVILRVLKKTSDIVGNTLGPGGMPVLIERQEHGLAPVITKDGVTVFRSLGFDDPRAQVIMESARDASIKTATEAGDGTTTATVLAEAVVRHLLTYTAKNPKVSPQRVVRRIERAFVDTIEPLIKNASLQLKDGTLTKADLVNVAKLSGNGDAPLADAVMEAFDLVGDNGNVTIIEKTGDSGYSVERIDGYPIGIGYEDSCGKFYPKFVNDSATQRCVLDDPIFLLFHGQVNDIGNFTMLFEHIGALWQTADGFRHNVVFVATHFSDAALADLAYNFSNGKSINVVPMLVPQSPIQNGQLHFLQDLQAITGATIVDQQNLHVLQKQDTCINFVGFSDSLKHFEMGRYRSTIFGRYDDDQILFRSEELESHIEVAVSEMEALIIQERLGRLTGGIARLIVTGPSNGETKEKRDRAEDAICAVRGAIKHGALPGGGWTLMFLCGQLAQSFPDDDVIINVLIPSLQEPVIRLLVNCGFNQDERINILNGIAEGMLVSGGGGFLPTRDVQVFDLLEQKWGPAVESGILDSTPAVLEAIRNALSIASQLGLLGGVVVFKRDVDFERQEAAETVAWLRDAESNPANERA